MTARLHTRISDVPLSIGPAWDFVADAGAGAAVVFSGMVRDQTDGRPVAALEYEAYVTHAEAQLATLARKVGDGWPGVTAVWMEHRVGRLAIGDPAVVVAVSAAHRDAAFDAARFGIDTLKETVAIWKHEHWADGGAHFPGSP
jgi:molybdopterin synthase catalytic subunit